MSDTTSKSQPKTAVDHYTQFSAAAYICLDYWLIYLRNKETQQTLRVIVNIKYDASF